MLSASTNVTFDSRFWTKTTLNHPIISQNHSLPFNYSKLDQYCFRLFNQGWATWKSLRVLQKDSECYEPDAEHYLGDPWRNTGSTTNKHKQHNHLSMFPSIIGHKPSGIHPGGGLGSGQRLRSGNCHSCLSHLRLPSNCTSHQVYEFTVPLFLTYQKYVTWSVLSVCRNAVKALQILSLALLAKLIDLKKQKKRLEIGNQHSAIPFLGLKSWSTKCCQSRWQKTWNMGNPPRKCLNPQLFSSLR